MYKQIFETIKVLSNADEKTVTQRALKTAEEVGELAKAVLPYEDAFATTHRFATANHILEESVDVMLCAMSIVYDMGFVDDDVISMMEQKCLKWNKLQQASVKGRFPLPFEIHVSVQVDNNNQLDLFKNSCAKLGVKPVVLELNDGKFDVMTSSIIMTNNTGAHLEMTRISQELSDMGHNVIRNKIETVPWHPAVPQDRLGEIPLGCYFESHINIVINADEQIKLMEWVKSSSANIQGHFSRNVFKKLNDEDFVQMLTLRSSTISDQWIDNTEDFTKYVNRVIEVINNLPFLRKGSVLKHVIEYAIFDSNVTHDESWVSQGE